MQSNVDKLSQLTTIQAILEELARARGHLSITELETKINERYRHEERKTTKSAIKRDLIKIKDDMGYILDIKLGPDGGYRLAEDDWKNLASIANHRLTNDEKNALNDAFEIAEKSATYYYYDDLQSAAGKLYLKEKLNDQDYEYYVGKTNHDYQATDLIKKIKFVIKNHRYVDLTLKYEYYKIPMQLEHTKMIYLIHDTDESFVVLKHKSNTYVLNVLNIDEFIVSEKSFNLNFTENIENYMNNYSVKVKGKYAITFKIIDERGHSIFNLWKHQCEDLSKSDVKKKLVFYEEYKVHEFLFRMQSHIKDFTCDSKKVIKDWNERVENLASV